jgi:hypothetical protein
MAWPVPSGAPRRRLAGTREAGHPIAITPGPSISQAVAAPVPVLVSGESEGGEGATRVPRWRPEAAAQLDPTETAEVNPSQLDGRPGPARPVTGTSTAKDGRLERTGGPSRPERGSARPGAPERTDTW